MKLSPDQLHTLRHMLGINTPELRVPRPYRDYYCANPGDVKLLELESIGAVECYRRDSEPNGYHWYKCTPAGRDAAIASFKTIRQPKSARVYSRFLDVRECRPDLTFRDFITNVDYAEIRRSA